MSPRGPVVLALLVSLLVPAAVCKLKCQRNKIKFILDNMNNKTVPRQVDCVVGERVCDEIGKLIKDVVAGYNASSENSREALTTGKCRGNCTCDQIQSKIVLKKLKKKFRAQYRRLAKHFKNDIHPSN